MVLGVIFRSTNPILKILSLTYSDTIQEWNRSYYDLTKKSVKKNSNVNQVEENRAVKAQRRGDDRLVPLIL